MTLRVGEDSTEFWVSLKPGEDPVKAALGKVELDGVPATERCSITCGDAHYGFFAGEVDEDIEGALEVLELDGVDLEALVSEKVGAEVKGLERDEESDHWTATWEKDGQAWRQKFSRQWFEERLRTQHRSSRVGLWYRKETVLGSKPR